MKESLKKAFSKKGKVLLVGIGSDLRGDDGVGPYIANRLLDKADSNFKVINAGPVIENFVDEIIAFKPDKLIIIDAAFFPGKPGEIKILKEDKLSDYKITTTHSIPLTAILKIIKQDLKNTKIVIVGIRPEKIDYSEELSPAIKKSADEIIEILGIKKEV